MNNDVNFYNISCNFIKELMSRHTPIESLEKVVYPLLNLINSKYVDRNLINLVVLEQPNHNASEYYPLAYHILDSHPHFYDEKPKELAAFAWEMAGKLGCNDGTDELFIKILPKLKNFINYDYLEEVKNSSGASSIAHEIFYNKNSKSRFVSLLLELGANLTKPSNNYNSALDRHFLNWEENIKFQNFDLNEDDIDTIKILVTHPKTANSYLEHLKKYPRIEKLGVVQSIGLNFTLENTIPVKISTKSHKKI